MRYQKMLRLVGARTVCLGMLMISVPGFAKTCPNWNTEEYFETATIADVEGCLRAGSDPNARDERDQTPLHLAAWSQAHPEIVTLLAAAGADPNAVDQFGIRPLHRAVMSFSGADLVSKLVAVGADPNARQANEEGWTPLHIAVLFAPTTDAIRALVDAGADPGRRDESGMTPLHMAATPEGSSFRVAGLIAVGADVNARDEGGGTPLHVAVESNGDFVVTDLLLDAGSDPFALAADQTPLAKAVANHRDRRVVGRLMAEHLAYWEEMEPSSWALRQRGLHKAKCWFDPNSSWPRKECYFMIVGEDPVDPTSNPVAFPVVRFVSQDQQWGKNPLLHLGGGGPGAPMGLHAYPAYLWLTYKNLVWRSGRDLYVIDPRGVGMSHPNLRCPDAVGTLRWMFSREMTVAEEIERWLDMSRECRAGLDQQAFDLSHYNSKRVAYDVEQLRLLLQVDKWVLYGTSYGTRYALTIARHFPETVEAMILAATTFPNLRYAELTPDMFLTGLDKLFAWCGRAGSCDPVGTRERLRDVVSNLDESPLVVENWSDETVAAYKVGKLVITGQRLLHIIASAQYDSGFFAKFPVLLEELIDRKTTTLEEVLWAWLALNFDEGFSDPVYYAHYCAEEHPFINYDVVADNVQMLDEFFNSDVRENWVYRLRASCEIWNVRAEDPGEGDPVKTQVPTLFLQGGLDPVTPVEYLDSQMQYFDHHEVLVFEESSHWGSVEGNCALEAAGHFVEHKALPAGFVASQCDLVD